MPISESGGRRRQDAYDPYEEIDTIGVTDAELMIRLRLPCTLHQKNFVGADGSQYQETILSKEQALILFEHLKNALFGDPQKRVRHREI